MATVDVEPGTRHEVFPLADYTERLQDGGPLHVVDEHPDLFRIPLGVTRMQVIVERDAFPDTSELAFKFRTEVSLDDGRTWPMAFAFTTQGKPALDPVTGLPATTCGITVDNLPEPKNANRAVKAQLIALRTVRAKVDLRFD